MKHYQIEQSDESQWKPMRAGKITMSRLKDIMANYGKAFGDPAKSYAIKLATEQITGKHIEETKFASMEKGHPEEIEARALYEKTFFVDVDIDNFYCSEKIGYSPDGGINFSERLKRHEGVIEIKARNYAAHYKNVERQSYEPASKWQCLGALRYGKFDWLDFISYCPDFPVDGQLYVYRMLPADFSEEFKMIDQRVSQFLELIETTKQTILGARYL